MTVAEMTERMTAAEEAHWIAFYRISPFGEDRADLRAALISQLIHNSNSRKPKKLEDFLLFREAKPKPGDDAATIRRNFERLMAAQRKR